MEVKEKILSIFTDVIGEQVTDDSTCEDMCFDSIDKALVAIEIEDKLGVVLLDEVFDNSNTVGDIIKFVTKCLNYGN